MDKNELFQQCHSRFFMLDFATNEMRCRLRPYGSTKNSGCKSVIIEDEALRK